MPRTVEAAAVDLRRLAWRWHFLASMLVVPFVLWQSVTGTACLRSGRLAPLQQAPGQAAPRAAGFGPVFAAEAPTGDAGARTAMLQGNAGGGRREAPSGRLFRAARTLDQHRLRACARLALHHRRDGVVAALLWLLEAPWTRCIPKSRYLKETVQ